MINFDMTIANNFLIKVNVFFLSLIGNELKILSIKRVNSSFWELPSKYLQKNEELTFVCERAANQIIYDSNIVNYQFRPIETNINGEEVEIDFLALNPIGKKSFRYNNELKDIDWFNRFQLNEKSILTKEKFLGVENFINKFVSFKYENILYFMKAEFTLTELQQAFINLGIKDKQFNEKRNFRKWLETYNKDKSFIKETNKRRYGNHRPAKIFTSII